MIRYEFVCAEDFDEDYRCDWGEPLPTAGSEWYTVCGRPFVSFGRWLGGVGGLGLVGVLLYGWMLRGARRRT